MGFNFAFSSELKAMLKLPFFKKEVDPDSLSLYTNFQYIPAPFSIYKNCNNTYCIKDICPDGEGRRLIGDDCCACPEEPHNCLTRDTRELWTEEKTKWCCENKNQGCPSQ